MLQLLNPIALLAFAAVIIPVLVHLWNVRKGKTLRVGSIALLTVSSRQRSNRLRINNWPLFLLRCLLLALLALLLAKPVWHAAQDTTKHPGWILISSRELPAAYAHYKPQIDSLLAAGLELHNLSAGFEMLELQDTAQLKDTVNDLASRPWPLLKVLDASLPKAFPLHVFVNNRLSSYQGDRPGTHLAIQWHSFAPDDSIKQYPALSYVTAEGKIKNIEWVTSPQGNWYSDDNAGATFATAPDTSVVRVAIYAGQYMADAQYIKAAMQAIAQFTGRQINVTSLASDQLPTTQQHLIFWLNEPADGKPRASKSSENLLSYIAPHGILFRYDSGHAIQLSSWLQEDNQVTGSTGQHKIYQYLTGNTTGTPVWTLADGKPLLTVTEQDGKLVYHYKSHFNPAWGDLVWEEEFVKTMLPLVVPTLKQNSRLDRRRVDDRQVVPAIGSRQSAVMDQHLKGVMKHNAMALSNWLWVLIFIVFAVERIMVFRQQQRMEHA